MMMLHMIKYREKASYSYDESVGSTSSSNCRIGDLGGHKIIIFSLFYFLNPLQRTDIVLVSVSIAMNQPLFASGFHSEPPHIKHILL
jgi:hypothetical protein